MERVQGLPLNGRQFANLAATLPGVGLAFHSDPTKGSNYAPLINGGAGRNINYQIDGGDNNDDTAGGLLQQFPLEAIQEFHFETQRFKAEYGRSNGGVMNVVTKSGTNRFQGTPVRAVSRQVDERADGNRNARGRRGRHRPEEGRLPAQPVRRQLRRAVDAESGPFLSGDRAHPAGHDANRQHAGTLPALDGVYPTLYRENLGTAKVSANLNAAQYLTVRYGRNTNRFPFNASPTTTPDNWGDANNWFNSANVNHTWVLGGTRLNELIFQYSNYRRSHRRADDRRQL